MGTIGNIWWVATLSREFEMTGCDQFLSTIKLVVSWYLSQFTVNLEGDAIKGAIFWLPNDDIVVSANSCVHNY